MIHTGRLATADCGISLTTRHTSAHEKISAACWGKTQCLDANRFHFSFFNIKIQHHVGQRLWLKGGVYMNARCLKWRTADEKMWGAQSTAHFRIVDLGKIQSEELRKHSPTPQQTLTPHSNGPKRRRSNEIQAPGFSSLFIFAFFPKRESKKRVDNCVL
jgi:hypothetical protein